MPMEQETMDMLIGGFSIIMVLAFIVVILLMFSKKRSSFKVAYGLVIVSFIFCSCAISQLLNAMTFDFNHPMASEEISLRLGIAGVLWAVSMLFLLFGLTNFSSVKKNLEPQ